MESFWQFVGAMSISLALVVILTLVLGRPAINLLVDAFIRRVMKDPYPENIAEMYNVFKKVGIQNVLETDLRGNKRDLERPFGSPLHLSPWDKLLLNPVYLYRKPIVEAISIDTKVIIGPQAKRPLENDLPVMIGGMGYGFGPSLKAKLALAKGADQAGTATNTGVGPFLPEERKHTKRLIIQYHRGSWGKDETILRQANAVEIQLGYGALASAPVRLSAENMSEEFRDYMKLAAKEELKLDALLEEGKDKKSLKNLVAYLRNVTNGVPIGVKVGATHHLEKELEIITACEIDFLTIDGAEGGINYGPAILADDTGLPTLPALCRATAFLRKRNLSRKVSLIISGGLQTPGHFLKAIALGASAVYIGTVAMLVVAHLQLTEVVPWEPPTELVYERGKYKDKLSVAQGAHSIANFLNSCRDEMMMAMRSMGKTALSQLTVADLCALTPEVAKMTGVELGLFPPKYQRSVGGDD